MQFGDRATRRNKRPTYALQRVKQQEIGGDQISDDEDDGCAALLALQSAVPSRPPPCSPKGGKAEDERGNTSSQNGSDCLLMDKRKQKRASSSGDTGPEHGPSSSGSAEDVIYAVMPTGDGQQGQQQRRLVQGLMNESQGDELSDMEVDIVSETEKGCQVWFPPLPGDMERRRFQRHGNRYVMNQPMIIPELRASKRKRGMESVPYDGSWDMGLLMDPLMSLQPMLQSGGPFPGVADGPGNSKLQSGGGWDDDDGDGEDGSSLKDQQLHHEGTGSKRRLIWSQELHERFLAAIRKLGVKNAVPKAILNLMGVEGMSRENVASHLQKYRMHLKMMGANSNLSPDEMMQMHVNGEIADDHRRWNESENKSRWPLSSQGGGVFSGSQLSLSSSPPPAAAASMRLWSSASTPLPGSPLSTNGGSSLALPSGIVRNLASNSHAMAAAGVPPPAALMLQGGVPSGVGAQQAATATATLGSLLGLPPLGLGGSWAPHLHASANQIDPSTPAALAAALMANGILSGGADGALSLAGLNGGLSASSLLRLLPSSIGEAAMAGGLMLPPGLFSLPSAAAALGEGGKIVDGNNPT